MNRKTIAIGSVVVVVLLGALVTGLVVWSNYQEDKRIEANKHERISEMEITLKVAGMFGMSATGLPEENNFFAYYGSFLSNPDLYTHVEFVQTEPLLEDCEWGVIYIRFTEITDRNLDRLNAIIESDSTIGLGKLSYPITAGDIQYDTQAVFDVYWGLSESQKDYLLYGLDNLGLYTQ